MKAKDLMTKNPKTVTADQSIVDVVKIMQEEDCGLVPIIESNGKGRVAGVVTDRDIALYLGESDEQPSNVRVREVMTTKVIEASPDDDVADVSRKMEDAQVRRILVCEGGKLVGVIATADLAREVKKKEVGRVIERISEP